MFDAMAEWMTIPLLNQEDGKPFKRIGLAHPTIAPYGVFKTRDGADILIAIQNDREWRVLADKVLGDAALGTDAKFATVPQPLEHRDETDAKVAAVFAQARCRAADEDARRRRHRLRARQRFRVAVEASAFAAHHGRRRRAARIMPAPAPSGPRSRPLRRDPGARRAYRERSARNSSASRLTAGSSGAPGRAVPMISTSGIIVSVNTISNL